MLVSISIPILPTIDPKVTSVNFGTTEVVCPSSFTLMITIVKNWATLEASSWPTRFVWGHDLGVQAWCCEGWVGWAQIQGLNCGSCHPGGDDSVFGWSAFWNGDAKDATSPVFILLMADETDHWKTKRTVHTSTYLAHTAPKSYFFLLLIHVVSSRQDLFPKQMQGT